MLQACWWSVCQSMSVYTLIASVTSCKTVSFENDRLLFVLNNPPPPRFRLPPAYTAWWSEPSWYSLGRIESLFENENASAKQIFRQTLPCTGHINECWAQLMYLWSLTTFIPMAMVKWLHSQVPWLSSAYLFLFSALFTSPAVRQNPGTKSSHFFVSFPIVLCILIFQYVIIFKYQSVEVFCLFYLLLFSWNRALLCNPGWPLCSKPPSSASQHIIGYNFVRSIVWGFKPTQF